MITEDQKRLDYAESKIFNFKIFEEKDVWTWNIFKKAIAAGGILSRYFELIEKIIDAGVMNSEDLDRFYKTKDNKSKSIEIVKSKSIEAIVNKAEKCKLQKRLLENTKIKAEYVKEGNFNFFKSEYSDKEEKLVFTALNKSQMEKNIVKRKVGLLFNIVNNSGRISEALRSVPTANEYDKDAFLYTFYFLGCEMQNLFAKTRESKYYNFWETARSIAYQLDKQKKFYEKKTEKSILNEANLIASAFDTYEVSLNQSISKTFDMIDKDRTTVESNTKIEKVESINPVSGFISIRNIRVKAQESQLSDSEIEKVVKDFSETNKFFEDLSALVRIEEDKVNSKSKPLIRLVSGDEIVALYNVSSYKGTAALDNVECTSAKQGEKEGTLFNSCMRSPSIKNRIKFYAGNDHFIKMLALTTGDGKYLMGRAVVWYEESTGKHYVDRMFTNCDASAEKMITFVNESKNFFFINASGVSKSLMKSGKFKSNFLIEFNGVKRVSKHTPYFDTMRSNLYMLNSKLVIGRPDNSTAIEANQRKDVVYYTEKSFAKIPIIIKKDINSKSETICQLCGSIIEGKAFKFGENYICSKHVTIGSDGEILAEHQATPYTIGESQAQKSYIGNVLTTSNIRYFKAEDVSSTRRVDNGLFAGSGICTSIIKSAVKKYISYYDGIKVDLVAKPLKKESKLDPINAFMNRRRNSEEISDFADYYSFKDYENIYFDPKTIKIHKVGSFQIATPVNPTESQLGLIKDFLKHIAILKSNSSNYKVLEDKKELMIELSKIMCGEEWTKKNPINLDKSLSISETSKQWRSEMDENTIKPIEIDGEIKKMKFMSTRRFSNYGELSTWPSLIPVECIDISNTPAKEEYERLLKMIA